MGLSQTGQRRGFRSHKATTDLADERLIDDRNVDEAAIEVAVTFEQSAPMKRGSRQNSHLSKRHERCAYDHIIVDSLRAG